MAFRLWAEDRRRAQSARRAAERAVAEAEAEVGAHEARVAELRARLEDPGLYLTPGGAAEASRIGAELEDARRALEQAFSRWEAATRRTETAG